MRPILGVFVALGAACYSPPHPDCGFICGAGGACPTDYTCAADNVCHYNSAASTLHCYADARPQPDSPDADLTPPMVLSTVPATGASNVSRNTMIVVTFDRPVALSTLNLSSFQVFAGASQVNGTYAVDTTSTETVFTLGASLLPANAAVTVTLNSQIHGQNGAPINGYSFGFTTIDDQPPTLASSVPADGDINVAVTATIDVTFSENVMNVAPTTFHISQGATDLPGTTSGITGSQWRFTPNASMPAASIITVHLDGGITDLAGNALSPVQFTFTTQ